MRERGLSARQGRRRRRRPRTAATTIRSPNVLARNFTAGRPDQVWLADVSYVPTDEGWLDLAAMKDTATRQVLSWSMADHLCAALCVGALVTALRRPGPPPHGLVHYSDRGGRYAAELYRTVLERHGITPSMGRRRNCLDNAPLESLFASLKVSTSTKLITAPMMRPGQRCSTTSKSSTIANPSTQAWATEPRPKRKRQ